MNVGIESVIFVALLNDANLFVYYIKGRNFTKI